MNQFKIYLLTLFLTILFSLQAACKKAAVQYMMEIKNEQQFKMLEGAPLSLKYGGITTVKVLYDIRKNTVYFINSRIFQYHYDFARYELGYDRDLYYFNEENYHPNNKREYVFGAINHYKGSDMYTYEFASSEKMSREAIRSFEAVKKKIFVGGHLHFFPATAEQMEDIRKIDSSVSIISADKIYENIVYQPIVAKESYGYLRRIDIKQLPKTTISRKDIILVNGTPNEVPLSAGIITSQLQPPLSHINILCHNRGTSMMACRNIWQNKYIQSLSNELVHLVIKNDTFTVTKASMDEAQAYWNKHRLKSVTPVSDLTADSLIDLRNARYSVLKYAGGKAAGFAELMRLQKRIPDDFYMPAGAFAITFYFYNQHVQIPGIAVLITKLLKDTAVLNNQVLLKKRLKEIRQEIKKQPLNEKLLIMVKEKMLAGKCGQAFRFRSSTNAEDLPGFNGAGLYDSRTGILNDTTKDIEKAIKNVWASLWNERAFMERQYFGIAQDKVYMGILCHQAMGTEEVNGVAITKNIYREDMTGHMINMQKGESSIVIPADSMTSEQALLLTSHTWGEPAFTIDYISYSSLNDNKPLLTQDEYRKLSKVLTAIKTYFYKNINKREADFSHYAMDVEFKFVGAKRKLYIKQAREYND